MTVFSETKGNKLFIQGGPNLMKGLDPYKRITIL